MEPCQKEVSQPTNSPKMTQTFYKISGVLVLLIGIASLFTLRSHIIEKGPDIIWLNGSISLLLLSFGVYLLYKGFKKQPQLWMNSCCSVKTIDKFEHHKG